jgi:hypothetical protein
VTVAGGGLPDTNFRVNGAPPAGPGAYVAARYATSTNRIAAAECGGTLKKVTAISTEFGTFFAMVQ